MSLRRVPESCAALGLPRAVRDLGVKVVGGLSIMSGVLSGLDPKPGELPMARLKLR